MSSKFLKMLQCSEEAWCSAYTYIQSSRHLMWKSARWSSTPGFENKAKRSPRRQNPVAWLVLCKCEKGAYKSGEQNAGGQARWSGQAAILIKCRLSWCVCLHSLRTNGVNTNGAAAKIRNFDRLGKKVRPGVGQREYPKKPLCKKDNRNLQWPH